LFFFSEGGKRRKKSSVLKFFRVGKYLTSPNNLSSLSVDGGGNSNKWEAEKSAGLCRREKKNFLGYDKKK